MQLSIIAILLLPVLGGLLSFLMKSNKWSAITASLFIFLAMIPASQLLLADEPFFWRFDWLSKFQLGWQVDRLSLLLVVLVLFISLLVHLFSISYMKEDKAQYRYFAFLGLFTSSMIGLLFADHLLLLFIFWELVGFTSYLLIGFWFQGTDNAFASRYAFIMNRVADVALLSGILMLGFSTGNFYLSSLGDTTSSLIAILLVIGAFGKSAQGPFFTWLPRAMAGPTPVSALIHAATMVAAGVYLLIRIYPILSPIALLIVAVTGALTAFVGAIAALTQYDIKKILAYSTISQLGYMVLAVGVGAPEAAFFHLWTHAFFKAGLFLSAGAVIHYMHYLGHHEHAQDMRAMGGIKLPLKVTFIAYTVCMLSLSGLPFFTGFLSKEGVLIAAVNWSGSYKLGWLVPAAALGTAIMTAYYMFRQWIHIFLGQYRGDHLMYHYKESKYFQVPLIVLALGSIWIWYAFNPLGHEFAFLTYLYPSMPATPSIDWLAPLSITLALAGLGIGFYRYRGLLDLTSSIEVIKEEFDRSRKGFLNVSFQALYVDFFYTRWLSFAFTRLGYFTAWLDRKVLDRGINGLGVFTVLISKVFDLVDKLVVDGLVNFVALISYYIGNFIRLFHAKRVQLQFFWAVILLLLVVIGFELIW